MKTGNWEYVYLTNDSWALTGFGIWNTNIGIVKYKRCVDFRSARSLGKKGKIYGRDFVGRIDEGCFCGCCNDKAEVKKQFGFVPPSGTAWLVNTTTLKRKRIDKDMALIDPDTGKVAK